MVDDGLKIVKVPDVHSSVRLPTSDVKHWKTVDCAKSKSVLYLKFVRESFS